MRFLDGPGPPRWILEDRELVELRQSIAVKIGGAWAVAGALWVRFYAGLREGRELRLEYQPSGRRFRGESDGDLDVTNEARIYLPRASL